MEKSPLGPLKNIYSYSDMWISIVFGYLEKFVCLLIGSCMYKICQRLALLRAPLDLPLLDYLLFICITSSLICPCQLTFLWWGCYVWSLRHKPTELANSFYSVLVSVSVFMALSTVFNSLNSPDNSPLSHFVLLVLFLPHWFFQLYISLLKSSSALM